MIPELNKLGLDVLNSRDFHAIALLGNLTGMDVVRKTGFHVRVLLSYITPAVAGLFGLAGERVAKRVEKEFPKSREWTTFKPNQAIIGPVSELIALILFGAEMTADNEALVNLTHEHTSNGKHLFILAAERLKSLINGVNSFWRDLSHAMRPCSPATASGMVGASEMATDQDVACFALCHIPTS